MKAAMVSSFLPDARECRAVARLVGAARYRDSHCPVTDPYAVEIVAAVDDTGELL